MIKDDIKWIHVELSSRCNAWCPACPRNKSGFGVIDNLIEKDLSTSRLEEILQQFPNLAAIQFCGNYGDPIIAKNILEAITVAKKYVKKIQIHTNGSLRSEKWWENLATHLRDIDHDVWFGIDGIGETHEIYRQGTSYKKIINNATAFITNGGFATWQFIPYAHNEHQVKESFKISQQLGFKKFKLAKLHRKQTVARHWKTGNEFELLPPEEFRSILRMPKKFTQVNPTDCMHLDQPSIFLAANGKLSTCCYLGIGQKETFDNVDDLLYNQLNLEKPICLRSCGS